jgi:hypothetical protein
VRARVCACALTLSRLNSPHLATPCATPPTPTHQQGILRGFDQTTNLILEECYERVYSAKSGVEQAVLGLYIIRGDNMCVRPGA